MTMNIYNLPVEVEKALEAYYACFDPDTGELVVTEEEMNTAQANLENMENKSEEVLGWYLQDRMNRLARSTAINTEVKRLKDQEAREKKEIARIEMLIGRSYDRLGGDKPMNVGTFTISYRKSEGTEIVPDTIIPEEFLRYNAESMTLAEANAKYEESSKVRVTIDNGAPDLKSIKDALKELGLDQPKKEIVEGDPIPELSEEEKKMAFAFIDHRKNLQIK